MTSYEMQLLAKIVADTVYEKLIGDEKFVKKITKNVQKKKRMLTTAQVAELLGVSQWTVRNIADKLGAIKANAKGDDKGKKRYGHLAFQEEGLIERYQEYLRTK